MSKIKKNTGWWFEPLWKIWLRQLGWWKPPNIFMGKCQIDGNHSPPTRWAIRCITYDVKDQKKHWLVVWTPLKNMTSSIGMMKATQYFHGKMPNWWQPFTTNQMGHKVHHLWCQRSKKNSRMLPRGHARAQRIWAFRKSFHLVLAMRQNRSMLIHP